MASSPAVSAKKILEDIKGVTGVIMVSRLTDDSDAQIAIYDTGGFPANPKWLLDYPTIQIMVRGEKDDYEGAFNKAKEVFDALLGLDSQDVNGDRWVSVTAMGHINFLEYDSKSRPKFSLNFRIILEPAASGLTNREPL